VYAKKNFQESHFQKKTFRSVNLLESFCKIVEFIFKIIVHISRSVVPVVGPGMAKGSLILSGEEVEVLSGWQRSITNKVRLFIFSF